MHRRYSRRVHVTRETIARSCFVCGSDEGEIIFRSDSDVCGLGRVSFAIRCCAGCGLTLQDPAVSPATMMRQYGMFSNYTAFGGGDPALSPTAARMLASVEAQGITPGRVYDVGAATGAMLWHFRQAGWTVSGCDPSPKAVEQARDLNDIVLDLGVAEETLLAHAGDLDLITFSHVLEHIYDPTETLRRVHDALAPGGHLMFEVPCLTAPEINPPGLFMMEHINYFDETSIENLLARVGFKTLAAPVTTSHWPFPVITVLAQKQMLPAEVLVQTGFAKNVAFGHAYVDAEQRRWDAVDARLRGSITAGEEIYIWGAGLHTSTMLERTGLGGYARIVAITDRDPQKHGHSLGPHHVVPPAEVLAATHKIVVSSYVSERDVVAGLRAAGVADKRIVCPHGTNEIPVAG